MKINCTVNKTSLSPQASLTMATRQVSVLAQFDDLCRGFNHFINGSDRGKIHPIIYILSHLFDSNLNFSIAFQNLLNFL